MLSAVIPSAHSYAALRLAPQQLHQRCVHPGPLVLGTDPLKSPTPTPDRDRTVSRPSEPSSRTTLIVEQPNPRHMLQPQSNCLPCTVPAPDDGARLDIHDHKGGISRAAPRELAPTLQSLPPILHMQSRMPVQSYSKGARGLSV